MGGLLDFLKPAVGEIIRSVGQVIDDLHTSDQEKLEAQLKLAQAEMKFREGLLSAETEWAKTQADVIKAEASGESWLQRNWRPILMLTFTFIVAWNFVIAPIFSMDAVPVPEQMWELLKIGIGGYIIGRSGEKIAREWQTQK